MKSSGINTGNMIEVDIEDLNGRTFDLAMHNVEFNSRTNNRKYYFYLISKEAISKVEVIVYISNLDDEVISRQSFYITEGLYHYDTEIKSIFIYILENLRGWVDSVENT